MVDNVTADAAVQIWRGFEDYTQAVTKLDDGVRIFRPTADLDKKSMPTPRRPTRRMWSSDKNIKFKAYELGRDVAHI
ncbi:unnamed protein product [Amoebophrya sp. A25]|nr:unnamed protein product [Amoebophrya sp. A25]|eukprot:GSA25T00014737001.1